MTDKFGTRNSHQKYYYLYPIFWVLLIVVSYWIMLVYPKNTLFSEKLLLSAFSLVILFIGISYQK
jgi:hypothetical protein